MTTAALTEIVRQPDKEQKEIVENLAARNRPEAVAQLISRGKVIDIADERERLEAIAQDYAKNPTGTLVISPGNRERSELNLLIHRELQRDGNVSRNDQQVLDECFADLLKGLVFDDEVMDWIVDALHQSHADEKRFRQNAITRLHDEQSKIQNRLDRLYDDRLDGLSNPISLSVRRGSGDRLRSV